MAQLKTPAGWVALGPAPRDHTLELTFAVKQTHTAQLEATLLEVSDPDSASYGQWLSNEDVHALVAPEPASREAVRSFLAAHGAEAHDATPNGDFVTASVTVAQAERMLGATYQAWRHGPSGHVVHRTDRYHLPAHVAAAVDFVSPTVQLPTIAAPRVAERGAAGPSRGNTPDSLRTLYGVGSDKGGASPKTKQAVTAFLGQLYNASDLTSFYQKYWPSGDASKIGMVGDAPPGLGGVESMLDIEYVTGMGGDVPTEFWGFTGHAPDNKENEPFLKWLQVVDSKPDSSVPQLFSTSYGEDEDSVTPAYAGRVVAEFQKIGARGISLLFASGDSGCARDNGKCHADGAFNSQWPAASPWVTAVGATEPYHPDADAPGGSTAESAAELSSGGFSDRWPRAAWQNAAVASYTAQIGDGPPAASRFNSTGAGFPDISAQGVGFAVWAEGHDLMGVAGTSCASPTAAGVFSLVNDKRLAAGKPALGFMNPLIYKVR